MKTSLLHRARRIAIWLALELTVVAVVLAFSVWADSPARLPQPKVTRCYCGCAESKASGGCSKMCELPKYASRWWAINCAKPRTPTRTPGEDPGAGPRLPHPAKAERASN